MPIIEIDDLQIPALRPYSGLTNAQLRSRRDPEQAVFIAESPKVIQCALNAGCEPISMLMDRKHVSGQGGALISRCGDIPVYTGEDALLKALTGYALTRGILCAMKRPAAVSAEEICRGARRVAVLEGIVDPTNVGAVFRSAAGLGMDGVLLTPTCCDPLHRRAVRVSMGTVFQIPWAWIGEAASDWPAAGMARLRGMGFRTVALALRPNARSIEDPLFSGMERLAVLLGTEGDGLREDTVAGCDYTAVIPMFRGVDSLNVAAASAVAFWQLTR